MSIRNCTVIAVEGSHSSGKSTLVHALTSHYREHGVHVTCVDEPARTSPFIEEVVLHGRGEFDLVTELDTFARQITNQLRAARHHDLLIADKTLINVVAYARLLLSADDAPVLDAMFQLCAATTILYDAVLYTSDAFNPRQPGDTFRSKVADQQDEVDQELRRIAAQAGLSLIEVPRGLATDERVRWSSARLAGLGLHSH